jgi:ABC-type proline/glycine betaine transport system permease subunit
VGQLLFGIKLFQLPDSLQGMLKPYCFFTILTGILIATIFLIPLASLTGAIGDVLLGTIFFKACEKPEEITSD